MFSNLRIATAMLFAALGMAVSVGSAAADSAPPPKPSAPSTVSLNFTQIQYTYNVQK